MPTIASQLTLRSGLSRILTNAEVDGNFSLVGGELDAILAGTAGHEAGNALKLGGQTLSQLTVPGAYAAPTLLNSWINYGGSEAPAGYLKFNGIVYIRGLLKSGVITSGTDLFVLPAGFRPAYNMHFTADTPAAPAFINVLAAGHVQSISIPSNTYLGLSISFKAEQ